MISARVWPVRPDRSDADVYALALTILDGNSPVGRAPSPADLDRMARRGPEVLAPLHGDEQATVAAALITAQARTGHLDEALELCTALLDAQPASADWSDPACTMVLLAAAESYATAGWPRRATFYATRAASYAHGLDAALEYRAQALVTVGRALNGEYETAAVAAGRCASLFATQPWRPSTADYPLLLGQILIASARLDHERLQSIAIRLTQTGGSDPLWTATARACEAMALLAVNDYNRALPLVMEIVAGVDEVGILDMIRGFATGIAADLLLARGEARRTITFLAGRTSPPGHAVCFDMQRSAARLMLGEDREVLQTTDGCVKLGADHCLRTISPVLLRRAVALERLGQTRLADEAFEEGFHLVSSSGSATPFLTLPRDEVGALLERLQARRPEYLDQVMRVRSRLVAVPVADSARTALPRFTRREAVLAARLRSEASYAEISRQLHVSPATIKTQTRSLYRKLGVGSRAEAVTALERSGFFD